MKNPIDESCVLDTDEYEPSKEEWRQIDRLIVLLGLSLVQGFLLMKTRTWPVWLRIRVLDRTKFLKERFRRVYEAVASDVPGS